MSMSIDEKIVQTHYEDYKEDRKELIRAHQQNSRVYDFCMLGYAYPVAFSNFRSCRVRH